jgi:hypothetical protein
LPERRVTSPIAINASAKKEKRRRRNPAK